MFTIRASSWPTLFDCSLRWYFDNVVGLRMPSGTPSRLGTAIHSGCAEWDRGVGAWDAADVSAHAFLNPSDEVEQIGQIATYEAVNIARKVTYAYTQKWGRREFSHVELEVAECIVKVDGYELCITGHVDRISNGEVKDLKTGARRVNAQGVVDIGADHLQLGVYSLMASAELGRDVVSNDVTIIGGSTTTFQWAERTVHGAMQIMLGDDQSEGILSIAAKMLKHGVFAPNPKSLLCSEKYCAAYANKRCKYHGK